jgi:hypothetical protein
LPHAQRRDEQVAREPVEVGFLVGERARPRRSFVQAVGPHLDVPGPAQAGSATFGRQQALRAPYVPPRDAHHLRHGRGGAKLDVGSFHGVRGVMSSCPGNTP